MKKLLILVLAIVPLTVSAQWFGGRAGGQNQEAEQQFTKLAQFYQLLNNTYIDSVDNSKLVEAGIKQMLSELDPHSTYMSPEEMRATAEQFQGNFSGIGIEFNVLNDTIIVVNTIAGGPSEDAGLKPNDRIVGIEGKSAIGITREEAPKLLRGPKGSTVDLTVRRTGAPKELQFRITRGDIPITTMDATYKIDDNIGYMRVNKFADNTMIEFREAMNNMKGINSLILDLRGNGGGYLHMAIDMANYFLDEGNRIVSTEGMRVRPEAYDAQRRGEFRKGNVVVLLDDFSASASEIVSGALQDWDRAVIVGRRSFGKGLVQRQYPLNDESAVRITVAKYLTPTGRAIQRPFERGHREDYYEALSERLASGADELDTSDSLHSYKTLRLGKTVYGGGGIYPDYYVPADTVGISDYYSSLSRMGVINEFIVTYLDHNRTTLEKDYPTFDKYLSDFTLSEEAIQELVKMGEVREVPYDKEGLDEAREKMSLQIKALIAQRLWNTGEYFKVMNPHDKTFQKGVEVLRNWKVMAKGIATDSI
ncbi:PDZ domain-containing protein [Alistipes sp. OttesenSCG-928-B03]|nr:PDZ domain-containing protein [Alistipes sp. OttesenSCG-928-B03]